MKKLINIINEKLVINKHSKIKQNPEFYLVWPKSYLHDLFVDFEEYIITPPSTKTFPEMLLLPKNDIWLIDEDEIKISKVVVYDISPIYGNDKDKFKEDFTNGRIGWKQIKEFKILTYDEIKNIN